MSDCLKYPESGGCSAYYNCCSCGNAECGCYYCYDCNACENCYEDDTKAGDKDA